MFSQKKKKIQIISLAAAACVFLSQLFADVISSFSHFTDIWRTLSIYVFDLVTNVSADCLNKINCLQEYNRQKVLLY